MDIKQICLCAFFALTSFSSAQAKSIYVTVQPILKNEAEILGDQTITMSSLSPFNEKDGKPILLQYDSDTSYIPIEKFKFLQYDMYMCITQNEGDYYVLDVFENNNEESHEMHLRPGEGKVIHLKGGDFLVASGAYRKM